uniref:Uncharacterized protein n=1 Tax=Podoviridae sp. ctZkC8 TaxID=2825259 RepID=A0A8S5UC77_9CAUD|nr:MAG TPA: hypothetical protein [Podoviridae sp. ctZkC8]
MVLVVIKLLAVNSHMIYLRIVLNFRIVLDSLHIQQCLIR